MIAEIQVLPRPVGTPEDRYAHVDAAIAAITRSGLAYEVGAMGTTIEGTPDEIWPLLRTIHEATLAAGAEGCMSMIKVSGSAADDGPSVQDLVGKHRA
ncbi:thiamine-binding protein [Demequina sp. NBRC 110055]|uniref:thiamine-binding protein n=1 Tax=Demequina sp. NBRC 110055 TaxID=1570344 RepID=UPI0009FF495D|nr:thiamine-binding protein [Demequina sp. NBRC 110055]